MSVILKQTKNYDMFTYDRANRPIERERHRKLLISMKEYGFIKSFPLTVKKSNGGYVIHDGQHRHTFARDLDIPVYYVEVDQDISIPEINTTPVGWTMQTYVDSFAKRGFKHYQSLLWFQKEYKLPLGVCISLLEGNTTSSRGSIRVRDGNYKVKDQHFAQKVAAIINKIKKVHKQAAHQNFVRAISAVCRIKDIDLDRLVKSIENHPDKIVHYSTQDAILSNLESIYNFNRRSLYPLSVNARNAMKKHATKVNKNK